jgi:hypothetical protein
VPGLAQRISLTLPRFSFYTSDSESRPCSNSCNGCNLDNCANEATTPPWILQYTMIVRAAHLLKTTQAETAARSLHSHSVQHMHTLEEGAAAVATGASTSDSPCTPYPESVLKGLLGPGLLKMWRVRRCADSYFCTQTHNSESTSTTSQTI